MYRMYCIYWNDAKVESRFATWSTYVAVQFSHVIVHPPPPSPNIQQFSSVSPRRQNQQICTQSLRNSINKQTVRNHKKLSLWTDYFIQKPGFEKPCVQMSTQNSVHKATWKRDRKEIEISNLSAPKSFKIGSRNWHKINANPIPDPLVSFLLLPWSSRVPPRCRNGSPAGQNWSTKPPKWQPRGAKKILAAEGVSSHRLWSKFSILWWSTLWGARLGGVTF